MDQSIAFCIRMAGDQNKAKCPETFGKLSKISILSGASENMEILENIKMKNF